jgi:hypothetical protein
VDLVFFLGTRSVLCTFRHFIFEQTPAGVNNNFKYGGMSIERKTAMTVTNNSADIHRHTGDTLSSSMAPYLQSCNIEIFAISTSDIQNTTIS